MIYSYYYYSWFYWFIPKWLYWFFMMLERMCMIFDLLSQKTPVMTLLTLQGGEEHVLVLDVTRKGPCILAFKSYLNWKILPLHIHRTWELSFIFLNLIAQYKKFDCLISFKKFIDKNHVSFLILFWIYVLLLLFSNLIF